jgi:hypothetical protein
MFPVSCMLRFWTLLFKIYITIFFPRNWKQIIFLYLIWRRMECCYCSTCQRAVDLWSKATFQHLLCFTDDNPSVITSQTMPSDTRSRVLWHFVSTYSPFIIIDYVTWYFKPRSDCMITDQCLYLKVVLIRFIFYVLCDKSVLTKPIKLRFSFIWSKVHQYKPKWNFCGNFHETLSTKMLLILWLVL